MSYTFEDIGRNVYNAELVEEVELDNDIITNKVTGYFAMIGERRIEVTETVYKALKDKLK